MPLTNTVTDRPISSRRQHQDSGVPAVGSVWAVAAADTEAHGDPVSVVLEECIVMRYSVARD